MLFGMGFLSPLPLRCVAFLFNLLSQNLSDSAGSWAGGGFSPLIKLGPLTSLWIILLVQFKNRYLGSSWMCRKAQITESSKMVVFPGEFYICISLVVAFCFLVFSFLKDRVILGGQAM